MKFMRILMVEMMNLAIPFSHDVQDNDLAYTFFNPHHLQPYFLSPLNLIMSNDHFIATFQ